MKHSTELSASAPYEHGPQLMKLGYDINLQAKDLSFTVTTDSKCVANGLLNPNSDLLEFEIGAPPTKSSTDTISCLPQTIANEQATRLYSKLHYDFGHIKNHTIYKT
jgi:hypothetical protein